MPFLITYIHGIRNIKMHIVIHATDEKDDIYPLAVIECKAPEVYLDEKAYYQMIDYCEMLGATYVMLTNSIEQKCF